MLFDICMGGSRSSIHRHCL